MSYQCPLCHQPLMRLEREWYCHNNHHFDLAKEGYINLMPVQHKHSKQPGDSVEMMQARREFLDNGYYQPLRDEVSQCLNDHLSLDAQACLDIGCGEGYYTAAVAKQLQQQRRIAIYGLDIAKVAVRYAAKRYRQVEFCVASSHRLPFSDGSLDGILRIYAPCKNEELARTVKSGGFVLTVAPGPRHLYQLKESVYEHAEPHLYSEEAIPGFTQRKEQKLAYMMKLEGAQAFNLLQMTPFAWRASPEVKAKLLLEDSFECETDFLVRLYQRD